MDFLQLAKKRYAVRNYEPTKVEDEKLARILEAGRIAPTGANRQPQRMIVVREEAGLAKLKLAANIYEAPLAVIVCASNEAVWRRRFDGKSILDIDASIVTDHMMLEATELGLGTIWICLFDPEVIRREFDLPDGVEPVNILAIGYAAGEPASPDRHDRTRKPLDEIVSYETYRFAG